MHTYIFLLAFSFEIEKLLDLSKQIYWWHLIREFFFMTTKSSYLWNKIKMQLKFYIFYSHTKNKSNYFISFRFNCVVIDLKMLVHRFLEDFSFLFFFFLHTTYFHGHLHNRFTIAYMIFKALIFFLQWNLIYHQCRMNNLIRNKSFPIGSCPNAAQVIQHKYENWEIPLTLYFLFCIRIY